MKKLSKSLFTLLLLAVLAMSFTACGKNQVATDPATKNEASSNGTTSTAQNDANPAESNGTALTAQNDANPTEPNGTASTAQNDANQTESNGTASTSQNDANPAEPNGTDSTAQTQTSGTNLIEKSGLWQNATYLEDTEFGQGSRKLIVEVKADNQTVKFTVHTDETTVGAALLANNLIDGEDGAYGLYVKVVNGITADYDIDQSYWAFYIDGEYAMSGVDTTDISEGSVYCLERTK